MNYYTVIKLYVDLWRTLSLVERSNLVVLVIIILTLILFYSYLITTELLV